MSLHINCTEAQGGHCEYFLWSAGGRRSEFIHWPSSIFVHVSSLPPRFIVILVTMCKQILAQGLQTSHQHACYCHNSCLDGVEVFICAGYLLSAMHPIMRNCKLW